MSEQITELHEDEIRAIYLLTGKIMRDLKGKYIRHSDLTELHKRIVGQFEDIGFRVNVNFEEWILDRAPAPIIEPVSRVKPIGEFDFEKKRYDILKGNERNGR